MKLHQIKDEEVKPEPMKLGSDTIDLFIYAYLNDEDFAHIREEIRAKDKTLDSENLSYRIINHWHKEGIISDLRPAGKGWRKYSLIDRLWIEVIVELRKLGYPLERIKKVKEGLEWLQLDYSYSMTLLEAYFVITLYFREPSYLLIFSDDTVGLAILDEYDLSGELRAVDSFININLNRLAQRVSPYKDLEAIFKPTLRLSPEEMQIMLFVRTGNFETITVTRKNGKIDFIEATEMLSADARLTEILKEQDYQNIEVKTANRKVVCVKRTIKKKV